MIGLRDPGQGIRLQRARTDEARLTRVLDDYAQAGAQLSFRPHLAYLDARIFHIAGIPCSAYVWNGAADDGSTAGPSVKGSCAIFSAALRLAGVHASQQAITQHQSWLEAHLPQLSPYSDAFPRIAQNTIGILRSYFETKKDEEQKSECLRHEVWHLIELERGVANVAPLIDEGTATYAQHIRSSTPFRAPEQCTSESMLFYEGAASVIHQLNPSGTLEQLFDIAFRLRAQDAFAERLVACLPDVMHATDAATISRRRKNHECLGLGQSITRDSLLASYRRSGGVQLACELAPQDISRLVDIEQQYADALYRSVPRGTLQKLR